MIIIIYIYIYLHLPRCAKFQTLMRKTPLPHEGPKKMTRGWNPFLIRIPCHLLLKCHFLEEIMGQAAKQQKWTTSFHMNFFTWDTPQVNKFIWISLLRTPQRWAMNFFCTWDTSQVNKFIWISWPGTRQKWTTSMWVWSHVYWEI